MFSWLKKPLGLILITASALAAFASTGNAGVLASSRYPLAMARDNLLPKFLTKMNDQRIPFMSIIVTGLLIIVVILTQSEESIAKFASAFQLLLFLMINLSVIIMRESKITTYDPGFKSPFYPWTQLFGILVSVILIIYMGISLILILLLSISLFFLWYKVYAAKLVVRRGAIYHWFALLGSSQFDNLESELWCIMKDKGIRENDPVNSIINNADILDLDGEYTYKDLVEKAITLLSPFVGATSEEMELGFLQKAQLGSMPITKEICVSGLRFMDLSNFKLVVIRCKDSFSFNLKDVQGRKYSSQKGKLAFFLISPESEASIHLRLIAHWINSAENNFLVDRCMLAKSTKDIKDVLSLKRPQNVISITDNNKYKDWINKQTKELPSKGDEIIVYITRKTVLTHVPKFDKSCILITSGLKTWKSSAKRGYWISGTSDSLGQSEITKLKTLFGEKNIIKLTFSNEFSTNKDSIDLYELKEPKFPKDIEQRDAFFWMSPYAFRTAVKMYPSILNKRHSCGMGNTYDQIKELIKDKKTLTPYLSYEDWLNTLKN